MGPWPPGESGALPPMTYVLPAGRGGESNGRGTVGERGGCPWRTGLIGDLLCGRERC